MRRRYRADPMEGAFDDAYPGFLFVPPAGQQASPAANPPVDVFEGDEGFLVHVLLPGTARESINVTVEGSRVSIEAELPASAPAGWRALLMECPRGSLRRQLDFGEELDSENAVARYRDGVLELLLPRRSVARGRRVPLG